MRDDGRRGREVDPARVSPSDTPEMKELDTRSLVTMHDVVYLGGRLPVPGILAGHRYDVPFLEDQLLIVARRRAEVLAALPYSEVEDVEIGGPGLVKSGGRFIGGGFGVTGAIEGMAIGNVLNGLTSRTSIETVVRIQGTNCELFLLHTRVTPNRLRMDLSRALGVIRAAQAKGAAGASSARSVPPVEELARLADMLEKGLLTREEFDLMKAKFLAS